MSANLHEGYVNWLLFQPITKWQCTQRCKCSKTGRVQDVILGLGNLPARRRGYRKAYREVRIRVDGIRLRIPILVVRNSQTTKETTK